MAEHNKLGKLGEKIATEFLIKNGYEIRERNWRYRKAEVDIIAENEKYLIAIEVKTRSSVDFGDPQDFVSKKKIQLLVEAMNAYMELYDSDKEVRLDIIALTKVKNDFKIEHLKDAVFYY